MRTRKLSNSVLDRNYGNHTNAFWKAFGDRIELAFADHAKRTTQRTTKTDGDEVLFVGEQLQSESLLQASPPDQESDWSWYVVDR